MLKSIAQKEKIEYPFVLSVAGEACEVEAVTTLRLRRYATTLWVNGNFLCP